MRWPSWARDLRDSRFKLRHKAVLGVLASRADKHGQCYPEIATIADDLATSDRTVERALRDLEAWGIVRVDQRYKGAKQTSNLYTLLSDGCQFVTRTGVNLSPDGCQIDTRSSKEGEADTDPLDMCGKHCGNGAWIGVGETCTTCGWIRPG